VSEGIGQADAGAMLDELAQQELDLQFTRFDNDVAWELGVRLVEAARAQGLPLVVCVRRGAQRLFHAALPGTAPDNDAWLDRKCRVVERFGRSSYRMGAESSARGRSFEDTYRLDPGEFAAHGGAFPVTVRGVGVVGVVAVSGLPQAQDHAFVVEVLRSFLAGG
jgi:uncharacterized protein (UPF0303 family)